jgi:hypothetical protein
MADWFIGMIVSGAKLESVLELLHPHKVKIERLDPVAGTPRKIRAGDKPAWQMAVNAATPRPQPITHFVNALVKGGVPTKSAYGAVAQAVTKRALHKTKVKGVNHYALPRGGKK